MYRLRASIATRLVLGYGLLVAASFVAVSAVFYFGTIGVLDRGIDGKIVSISNRMIDLYQTQSIGGLSMEINRELADGIDSDTELFLVVSPKEFVLPATCALTGSGGPRTARRRIPSTTPSGTARGR